MRKETKVGIIGVIVGVIGIGITILLFLLPYRVKNMNDVYINVGFVIAGVFIAGGILTSIFAFTTTGAKLIKWGKSFKFQSPLTRKAGNSVNNERQSKSFSKPITNQTSITNDQKELLEFYERQKANWKNYIRLKIVRVVQDVTGDVPKVIFWLEMTNFLPVEFRLVKVTHSEGDVGAGGLGGCHLPSLSETIDERIGPCSEKQFKLEMGVYGTNVPNFLSKVSAGGQLLQWMLKGEWYVEIYGKLEVWQHQSYQITYDQVIPASEVIERRGI